MLKKGCRSQLYLVQLESSSTDDSCGRGPTTLREASEDHIEENLTRTVILNILIQ